MSTLAYRRVSGSIFVLVAVAHALRAVQQLPATVGSTAVPLWISWVATAGGALLALWAFGARD
jgi:hypothetical protein